MRVQNVRRMLLQWRQGICNISQTTLGEIFFEGIPVFNGKQSTCMYLHFGNYYSQRVALHKTKSFTCLEFGFSNLGYAYPKGYEELVFLFKGGT